jgi:hypothetical protein
MYPGVSLGLGAERNPQHGRLSCLSSKLYGFLALLVAEDLEMKTFHSHNNGG